MNVLLRKFRDALLRRVGNVLVHTGMSLHERGRSCTNCSLYSTACTGSDDDDDYKSVCNEWTEWTEWSGELK